MVVLIAVVLVVDIIIIIIIIIDLLVTVAICFLRNNLHVGCRPTFHFEFFKNK